MSLATRRELIQAIAGRYHSAARSDKKEILDEFTEVTRDHVSMTRQLGAR